MSDENLDLMFPGHDGKPNEFRVAGGRGFFSGPTTDYFRESDKIAEAVEALPDVDPFGDDAVDEADYEDDTLGPCGCVDYHMADCPTRDRSMPSDEVYPNYGQYM